MKIISSYDLLRALFSRKTKANCGHITKYYGWINPCKERQILVLPPGPPTYCLKCLENTAIKCVKCGSKIFSGEPFSLIKGNKKIVLPHYEIIYSIVPLQYVICCICDPNKRDHGTWSPEKYKQCIKNSNH